MTTYMNLELPTPTVTLGPTWASNLNTALTVVDEHDHTSGKGVPIPSSGLNINADLTFGGFRATSLLSTKFSSQLSTLTGASNAASLYVVSGDLYYTNNAGTAIQLTSGNAVAPIPSNPDTFQYDIVNTNLVISSSDNYAFLSVDTTSSRNITLPAASDVDAGRFYIFADADGQSEANNITLTADGSDTIAGASTYVINSNYGSIMLVSNGLNAWRLA